MESRLTPGSSLAADITRAASKQTFYTIRFLVDSGRVEMPTGPMPISVGWTIGSTRSCARAPSAWPL